MAHCFVMLVLISVKGHNALLWGYISARWTLVFVSEVNYPSAVFLQAVFYIT